MRKHDASCSCGQLTLSAEGVPIRVSLCHCLACQRRTGSAFGQQARFARESISIRGNYTQYVRIGDSGGSVTFSFCPCCGATVFFELSSSPEIIAVPVGAFADPTFMAPSVSIFNQHQHGWVEVPESMQRLG